MARKSRVFPLCSPKQGGAELSRSDVVGMRVRANSLPEPDRIAYAVGRDAGDRRMAAQGRVARN